MCVYVHACYRGACVYLCVCDYMEAIGQCLVSSSIILYFFPLAKQKSLEPSDSARLVGQEPPGICLFPPVWDYKYVPSCPDFYVGAQD